MILTATQIGHLSRNLKQRLVLPRVAVIGGYHGGNLGDMALGLAVNEVLRENGITSGLQTIYNLEKWVKAPFGIVGGGAIGYTDSLLKVHERYKEDFSKLAFLGVDFNETDYPDKILKMIREAAFVSCRSGDQVQKLKHMSGRHLIYHHSDIAFSLIPDFCSESRSSNKIKEKKAFVNVVPLYGYFEKGKIVPNENYKKERPELYENFDLMHKSYSSAIRNSIKQVLDEGYEVEAIPFTPLDREYSKFVLDGLPIVFPAYHIDSYKMLKKITTGERIICTRYHATIFGMKAGAKVQPIAYAKKNELMLEEFGMKPIDYLSSTDLAMGKNVLPEGWVFDNDMIKRWENNSRHMIQLCIESLLANE